jgi:hypothetical protein
VKIEFCSTPAGPEITVTDGGVVKWTTETLNAWLAGPASDDDGFEPERSAKVRGIMGEKNFTTADPIRVTNCLVILFPGADWQRRRYRPSAPAAAPAVQVIAPMPPAAPPMALVAPPAVDSALVGSFPTRTYYSTGHPLEELDDD